VKAHYEQKGRVRYKFSYQAAASEMQKLLAKARVGWLCFCFWQGGGMAMGRKKRARRERRSRLYVTPSEAVHQEFPVK